MMADMPPPRDDEGWEWRVYRQAGDGLHMSVPLARGVCDDCGARTALVHPLCVACTRQHMNVEVRPSAIAGMGLFATADVAAGAFIAPYGGEPLSAAAVDRRYGGAVTDPKQAHDVVCPYGVTCEDGRTYDAGIRRGAGAYANHAPAGTKPNAAIVDHPMPHLSALRRIRAGDEIYLDYGADYWDGGIHLRHETVAGGPTIGTTTTTRARPQNFAHKTYLKRA